MLFMLVTMIAASGCATIHRNEATYERHFLLPAGFEAEPANDPEHARELHTLPPLRMVAQDSNGHLVYRLADPYVCGCVYVGDADTLAQYQRLVSEDFLDTVTSIHLQ